MRYPLLPASYSIARKSLFSGMDALQFTIGAGTLKVFLEFYLRINY